MRRTLLTLLAALVVVLGLASVVVASSSGASSVTRPRLERSLATTFANLYAARARQQGRDGIAPASLHPAAMCDKAGAQDLDVGPGGDWVCLMSWHDPEVPMPPEGYGKFELNVHSNDCYTVSSPSKLTGFLTMADARGHEVANPVFEFDGCFDPQGDDTPTGTTFPSLLGVASTTVQVDARGRASLQVTCGSGEGGCVGTITVDAPGGRLGTMPLRIAEESAQTLPLPAAVPSATDALTVTVTLTRGVGPAGPVTLPVERS